MRRERLFACADFMALTTAACSPVKISDERAVPFRSGSVPTEVLRPELVGTPGGAFGASGTMGLGVDAGVCTDSVGRGFPKNCEISEHQSVTLLPRLGLIREPPLMKSTSRGISWPFLGQKVAMAVVGE